MTNTSITFVDSRVANYQDLIDSLPHHAEVFVLNSASHSAGDDAIYLFTNTHSPCLKSSTFLLTV